MTTKPTARQLRNLVEPIAAQVYFAPEAAASGIARPVVELASRRC
jgi:hypothetical protein